MRRLTPHTLWIPFLLSFNLTSQAGAPFLETNGRVVVEAEHFDSRKPATDDDHVWKIAPDELSADEKSAASGQYQNARGGKYMVSLPDSGQNRNNPDAQAAGPYLDYKVQINTTGEYTLYIRSTGFDGASDSIYIQIVELRTDQGGPGPDWYRYAPDPDDGDFATKGSGAGWDNNLGKEKSDGGGGEEPASWNITKAGVYTVRVQQREDGCGIDAFVLQLTSLPAPTDPGPPESPISGTFVRIDQEPKDVTVALSGTATFTVLGSGSAALSYQWQRAAPGASTFGDLPGATAASYTTPTLTLADNGSKYRVNVAITGKSATSREALLTVDTQPPTIASVVGSGNFTTATVVYSEAVTSATAGDKANYSVDGGLTVSSVKVVNPTTVRLTTSKQTSGTKYNVTVSNVKDLVGNNIAANTKSSFTGFVRALGGVTWETYLGITGNAVDNLTSDPKYPNSPDEFAVATAFDSRLFYPNDSHEAYGGRMSGWLVPTESGQYELFIRSDDASQLFLSADDNPANLAVIAEETGCCGAFEESGANETSAPIALTAGKRYAIQALWKEGTGGDFCQVAWRKVGDTTAAGSLSPIPGKFLETYVSPDVSLNITQQPASVTAAAGAPVTISVRYAAKSFFGTTASIQWQKNGVDIPGATSQDLVIPFADPADNGATYHAILSVSTFAKVTSSDATLTVTVDKTPPALVKLNGTAKWVRLSFSEPLDTASATDKANYSIDKGVAVTGAKIVSAAGGAGIVQLDTSGATAGAVYNVTVKDVKDKSNNPVAPNTAAGFIAYNAFFDFEDGQIPSGTSVYGPASILTGRGFDGGNALMLTPPLNSQQGGFLILDLVNGAPVTKFTAKFKLFIGEGSGNAADGFSFNMAADVPEATVGEEGVGSGITVSFDTYDNSGGEAPAVDVKYGGQEVATTKVPKARLVNNQYVDVTVQLNAGGTINLTHNTTNYYSKLALPGFSPPAGSRILMGARTGGEFERCLVDDFAVLINADFPTEVPKPPTTPPSEAPKFGLPTIQAGNLILTWTGTGTLQSADAVTGPWVDVANAKSPFTATRSGNAKFYRVKQ
jgi:hypothetical protein